MSKEFVENLEDMLLDGVPADQQTDEELEMLMDELSYCYDLVDLILGRRQQRLH